MRTGFGTPPTMVETDATREAARSAREHLGPSTGIEVTTRATGQVGTELRFQDYRFFDYEDAERHFARVTRGRRVFTHGLPPIVEVDDALFVPLGREIHDGKERVTGGLFRSDGTPIDEALLRRDQVVFFGDRLPACDHRPRATIAEPLLYLGGQNAHFGHLLLETMARAWALQLDGMPRRVLMHDLSQTPPISFPQTPHQRALMRGLDVGPDRLLAPSVPLRLRKVFVPAPGHVLYDHVYSSLRDSFLRVGERLGLGDGPESDQPLYLSRSALGDDFRTALGEDEFEAVLAAGGFRIFHPEQHDLATQIRVVHRHRHVFGFWGSAFRLVFFSPRHKSTWQLGSDFPTASYLLDRGVTGAEACFLRGSVACRVSDRPGDFLGVHAMRGQEVVDVLVDHGFLARPAAALREPPRHALVREAVFDEARRLLRSGSREQLDALALRVHADVDAAADQGMQLARLEVRADADGPAAVADDVERLHRSAADWWRPLLLCGRARASRGQVAEARAALRDTIVRAPRCVGAHRELARLADTTEVAVAQLREARARLPNARPIRDDLLQLLLSAGRMQDAVDLLLTDVDHGPDPCASRLELAHLYESIGAPADARHVLRDARQVDPWHREVLEDLVRMDCESGRYDDALHSAATLCALEPLDQSRRMRLAGIALRAGRPRVAASSACSALALRLRRLHDKLLRRSARARTQRPAPTPIASR